MDIEPIPKDKWLKFWRYVIGSLKDFIDKKTIIAFDAESKTKIIVLLWILLQIYLWNREKSALSSMSTTSSRHSFRKNE